MTRWRVEIPLLNKEKHVVYWWPWEGEASSQESAVLVAYTVFHNLPERDSRHMLRNFPARVWEWQHGTARGWSGWKAIT